MSTRTQLPQRTWDDADTQQDVAAVRAAAPLVHCLTNYVAAPLTANVLLAAGAVPAMVAAIEEVSAFAAVAGGVLLNVGTITTETANTFIHAAEAARRAGTPWVLDPVAVGAGLRLRDRVATDLLEYRPTIIRGNGSEILGLSGAAGGGKGPDSTATSEDALDAAAGLARLTGAVVAISGEVDLITDGKTTLAVPGGHPVMTKVTGVGCSLGALIAAYAAVVSDPLRAAIDRSAELTKAGLADARQAVSALRGEQLPTVDQLSTLVEDFRRDTGTEVTLRIDGTARPLPAEASLALFRGTQEALTNITRYAPGATTAVTVTYQPGRTLVTIEDRICPARTGPSPALAADLGLLAGAGGGHGLTAMGERAQRAGGTARAGPTDDGWLVELEVPA